MARMKWQAIYFCAAVTGWCSGITGHPVNNKVPERDEESGGPRDGYKSVESASPENCAETVGNSDVKGNALSDNALPNSFDSPVNRVMNLNGAGDKGDRPECKFLIDASEHEHDISHMSTATNGSIRTDDETEAVSADPRSKTETVASGEPRRKLQFPACPSGETIASEGLQEHHLPFSVFSVVMGFLQPVEFPFGLLKDAAEQRVPFRVLLLQVLKLEGLAAAWILLWAILSLCIPCAAIAQICCPAKNLQRLENHSSNSTINATDEGCCSGARSLGFCMHLLLIVFIANLGLMIGSNEQLTKSIARAPENTEIIFDDLERFVRNTKMQITFVAASAIDYTAEAIEKDLDDVEALIGIPFQQELRTTFGLDGIFQTLKNIQKESWEISGKVKAVILTSESARAASKALEEKLEELIPLLSNIHQQCSVKDRPLCETLVSSGLAVTYHTDEIFSDVKLKYLAETSTDPTFNASLSEAEGNYNGIPRKVLLDTESQRSEIRRSLQQRRMAIHKALRAFEDVSRSVISTIKGSKRKLVPVLEDIASRDLWRYLAILGSAVLIFVLWTSWMCGAPCGCENASRAIPYLIIGLTFACLISLVLWILGSAALLLGIHGQNIICNAFYDPDYDALSHLLDDNGIMYSDGGLFLNLLKVNETISVSEVLRNSEGNQSTYKTFKLRSIVQIERVTDYNTWKDLNAILNRFHVETKNTRILTRNLESYLMDLNSASHVNLTLYRKKASSSITGKDLNAFLDQAYGIAKQTTDSRTGSRLEKLIFKVRDIINHEYKMLNELKEEIFYDLTALDVVLRPFREKCEGLLGVLRKAQQGMLLNKKQIAIGAALNYTISLKSYLEQARTHVDFQIKYRVAKLRPLWSIFHMTRDYVCEDFVGTINALSFSCYFSILLIVTLTPITKRIIKRYREINEDLLSTINYRNASPEMIRPGRPGWQTPLQTPGTPETVGRRHVNEESAWASPRPPSSSGRSVSPSYRPTLRTISKARAPFSRFDSLKLIERSTWRTPRSPEATPRRWI